MSYLKFKQIAEETADKVQMSEKGRKLVFNEMTQLFYHTVALKYLKTEKKEYAMGREWKI